MQEQAGQLGALAQEVPVAALQEITARIDDVVGKASAILGGAAGQSEIGGAGEQAKMSLNGVAEALQAFAGQIAEWADYHGRGGG